MKQTFVLMALCIGVVGCDTTKGFFAPPQPEKALKPAETRGGYRPPVLADQVNPDNAKDKAKDLNTEMDRELQAAIEPRDKGK